LKDVVEMWATVSVDECRGGWVRGLYDHLEDIDTTCRAINSLIYTHPTMDGAVFISIAFTR